MKFRGAEPRAAEAKSRAPWEANIRHGSVREAHAGCRWSRVSLRPEEFTSSETLCHCPSETGADVTVKESGESLPQPYLNCSSPSIS